MTTITTHVLDLTSGTPAQALVVRLDRRTADGEWVEVAVSTTDADGRVRDWANRSTPSGRGVYRLRFGSGAYFGDQHVPHFFPEVHVVFEITEEGGHCHVPVLLGPFGYSTYRGS